MKPVRVNPQLLLLLLGGTLIRLLTLGDKALWLDEVLTAIFSLGREMADIPQGHFFPLSDLPTSLSLNPEASCRDIATTLARESTHPPLFFCWLQQWLRLLAPPRLVLSRPVAIAPSPLRSGPHRRHVLAQSPGPIPPDRTADSGTRGPISLRRLSLSRSASLYPAPGTY